MEPKTIVAYPPVDYTRPFSQIRPEEIDIYFHYTNDIGKRTCRAQCEHCYFMSRPQFHIEPGRAIAITRALREQGYNIGIAPADSFSEEALLVADAATAGSAFRLQSLGKSAWTAGGLLAIPGWQERLDRAWSLGYRSIVLSAHEAAGTSVPIAGITKAQVIQRAVENVRLWNSTNVPKRYAVSTTFTIRRDNCSMDAMRKMVQWGLANGIDVLRFNCFANFLTLPQHREFEMRRSDIETFFGLLAQLHLELLQEPMQLGISEDWGDAGIEQIQPYLGPEWQKPRIGWCRAGYRLFAMIEVAGKVVLTGCVDKWDPILGELVESDRGFSIRWDEAKIETLRTAIVQGSVYACYGGVGCNREDAAGFGTSRGTEQAIFGKGTHTLLTRNGEQV